MDRRLPIGSIRSIAGFEAELIRVDLDVESNGRLATSPPLEVHAVADLERYVDRARLLRGSDGAEPPYWALVWIGARAIAARLRSQPPASGTRVLDLGCGLGVSGIVAGAAGAHVTFADYVDEALAFARANAEHQRLEHYAVAHVDFTRDHLGQRFDLILAADVVYDPAHYQSLVDFLLAHLQPHGTILLSESLRADARWVIERLVAAGLQDRVDAVWVPEAGKRERTWLHTLSRISESDS